MKTVKLLAALAIPAMFAACSNEELVSVENTPQNMAEVVGEELIGTDISMELPNVGVQTRYAGGEWKWDTEDEMGLAWVLYKNATTAQDINSAPTADRLYANHLFYVNKNTNKFESRGNFYKGWHFGYYPFTYQEAIGEKSYTFDYNMEESILNADGTTNVAAYSKLYSQKLHLSALQFLTGESVNKEDYSLDSEIDFTLVSPLAQINISASPVAGSQFATNPNLMGYGINSITLNVGENVFASEANILPTKLHRYVEEKNVPENKEVKAYNKAELVKSFKEAIVAKGELASALKVSATQTVEENQKAIYTAGAKSAHVAFVLPATEAKTLDKATVSIVVAAGGGEFVIKHTGKEETAGSWQAANNAAIEALVAAYAAKADGKDFGGELLTNGTLKLNIQLHEDIFVAVWDGIMSAEQWNAKYKLASDLGIANPTFTLGSGADVLFTSTTLLPGDAAYEGAAPVVESITVIGTKSTGNYDSKITIAENMTWNNNVLIPVTYTNEKGEKVDNKAVGVIVNENVTLSVEGTEEVPYDFKPYRIDNNGVISVNGWGAVGEAGKNYLDNQNGEVRIEYGAYVYPALQIENEGIISYVVTGEANEKDKIATLVNGENLKGYANVNTLIIDGKTLDLSGKDATSEPVEGDRYEHDSSENDEGWEYTDLTEVNVVIKNDGVLKIRDTEDAAVANVTIENGGTVTNVNINGDLDITGDAVVTNDYIAGSVKAVATTVNEDNVITTGSIGAGSISGGVIAATYYEIEVTKEGITGDVTATNATVTANSITGNVTASGETTINNADVAANLTVTEGAVVALNNVNVAGTFENNGNVTLTNETAANIVTLTNNGTLTSNVDLNVATVALNPKSVTTLSSNGTDYDMTIWYTNSYTFKNMTLNGTVTQYAAGLLVEEIANAEAGATVILKGDVELAEPLAITKNVTLDLNGKTIKNTSDLWNDDEDEWSLISVTGGNVTIKNGNLIAKKDDCFPIDVKNGANLTIESGKFVGNISAVYCHEGSVLVKGGEFSIQQLAGSSMADDYAGTLNCYDDNYVADKAKIEVAGGKFLKFDPANNASEGTSTNLLVAGATSTADGDWYVVE